MFWESGMFLSLRSFLLLLASLELAAANKLPGIGSLNQPGAVLKAKAKIVGHKLSGSVEFIETAETTEVLVHLKGLPGGDHAYHIHENAISGKNCDTGGDHYNPTGKRVEDCKSDDHSTCQIGDLSSKFGKLHGGGKEVKVKYYDPSLKLSPSQRGIIGRSVVVHGEGKERIGCGTIKQIS